MVTMAMINIFRNEELKKMDWKMVLQVCTYAHGTNTHAPSDRERARTSWKRGTDSAGS